MAFCSSCGTQLVEGAKFCHECSMYFVETVFNFENKRSQEYVGKILKYSNCGAIITETTMICPDCGMKVTGRKAVSSVQLFKE